MNRELERTFQSMMIAIRDNLSDLASSDNGQDGENQDTQDTEQGKLIKDDRPRWVMGSITKAVQQ
jgi:hypothetical protein